jgi:hypothetical protein
VRPLLAGSGQVDPQARHAHKTRARRQDGYKAHVVVEPDIGIITGCSLIPASGPEHSEGLMAHLDPQGEGDQSMPRKPTAGRPQAVATELFIAVVVWGEHLDFGVGKASSAGRVTSIRGHRALMRIKWGVGGGCR